ncbi:hypothetical protein FEM48_Zijuj11G0147900 [Ziziphus jujuba var. spinosa]|uniref:Disease resistance RPP13-like protein 1 n=1 Tax=Ziziphus jujuba var. spinosa TaxID=714518 RepID=A0A978UJK0_ZIZJJ|nr:hypothetical protein FEM48_Zijuj11G0147900 [Ziziphus jujuba var. spinosa]
MTTGGAESAFQKAEDLMPWSMTKLVKWIRNFKFGFADPDFNEDYDPFGRWLGCVKQQQTRRMGHLLISHFRVLESLTFLRSLKITRFSNHYDLPSDMLIALSTLELLSITSCHMLEYFEAPNSLKSIKYSEDCIMFNSLSESFRAITALEVLELHGCPELEAFPNGLNNLSYL